jgi:hypothetical protein
MCLPQTEAPPTHSPFAHQALSIQASFPTLLQWELREQTVSWLSPVSLPLESHVKANEVFKCFQSPTDTLIVKLE